MRDDGLQLGTRDKVVQKMTREGAVEKNLSEHSERRVSERASDADFSHVRENEQLAGERLDSGSSSGTKIQQRRYHLDDSGGNRSSPDSGSHRLSDRSVRSENVDSDSRRHQQKKRMTLKYQKESQTDSQDQSQRQKQNQKQRNKKKYRLNFEEENSKGSNLGGRFSTLKSGAGKAADTAIGAAGHAVKQGAISGQNAIKSAFENGNQEEQDLSEDVVSGSEAAASTTAHKLSERSSKRRHSSEKSKRADKLEQAAEDRALRLHFESTMQNKAGSALTMLGVFAFIGALIAGAYYLLKIKPEKEQAKDVDEDREFYDDDEYENEDEWLNEDDDESDEPEMKYFDEDDFPDKEEE